jgi:hypothetical protein
MFGNYVQQYRNLSGLLSAFQSLSDFGRSDAMDERRQIGAFAGSRVATALH